MDIISKIIIAIDGYSSCGKSTMAKTLAKAIGYIYIDSGAMYRAVALYCIKNQLIRENPIDLEKLKQLLPSICIGFKSNATGESETYLNGINVERDIRSLDVAQAASLVSAIPFVREAMVKLQQHMGQSKGIVMDGRDIGTVVFPHAELKIFVTASPEIRAKRRFAEMAAVNHNITFEEVLANVIERDNRDTQRKASPLRKADDALVLDNSYLSIDEQFQWLLNAYQNTIHTTQQWS